MAEQMTIDQMLAGMTDEEKAQFIDQMTYQQNAGRLNKNQQAIAGLPGISQEYFTAWDGASWSCSFYTRSACEYAVPAVFETKL